MHLKVETCDSTNKLDVVSDIVDSLKAQKDMGIFHKFAGQDDFNSYILRELELRLGERPSTVPLDPYAILVGAVGRAWLYELAIENGITEDVTEHLRSLL